MYRHPCTDFATDEEADDPAGAVLLDSGLQADIFDDVLGCIFGLVILGALTVIEVLVASSEGDQYSYEELCVRSNGGVGDVDQGVTIDRGMKS